MEREAIARSHGQPVHDAAPTRVLLYVTGVALSMLALDVAAFLFIRTTEPAAGELAPDGFIRGWAGAAAAWLVMMAMGDRLSRVRGLLATRDEANRHVVQASTRAWAFLTVLLVFIAYCVSAIGLLGTGAHALSRIVLGFS